MGSAMKVSFRRTLAAAATLLCLALATPAGALAAPPAGEEDAALNVLGHAVLAAIGGNMPGHAVTAIGNSLALLDARFRIESKEAAAASAAESKAEAPAFDEVVEDPSELPPASAGTNGTVVPHTSAM